MVLIFKSQKHVPEFLSYNSKHIWNSLLNRKRTETYLFLDMYIQTSLIFHCTENAHLLAYVLFTHSTYVQTLTTRAYYICSNWTVKLQHYGTEEIALLSHHLYRSIQPPVKIKGIQTYPWILPTIFITKTIQSLLKFQDTIPSELRSNSL